jgi:hypothetical protein
VWEEVLPQFEEEEKEVVEEISHDLFHPLHSFLEWAYL